MRVLAIDQGTSATKALVVDPDGRIAGEGRAPVQPRPGPGGAVEQDPEELLRSVVEAGRAALRAADGGVDAIGLGNQGETVLRWDRATGRALGPALSWQDRRAVEVTRALAPGAAERLAQITGLPADPYFAGPKQAWLRRHEGAGGVVTTIDAWVLHRLSGAFATDAATASRTLLLDLDAVTWSDEAHALLGLQDEERPAIVDCAGAVGETAAFGASLPITGLAVDQQAALFAEACLAAGDAKCTYGTGAFLLATTGPAAPRSAAGLAACVAWRLGGRATYCLDGQAYSAGSAVGWLQQVGLIGGPADLDAACAAAADPPAATFVPALAGLAAPFWAPEARGGFVGLTLATGRDDLAAALVWGLAAQVAALAQAVAGDLGAPLTRLRADGGLTRSAALMQAQADLLQAPVELYPSAEATALGVGALARLGAGGATTPEEAVGTWRPAAVYEPLMGADEAAERLGRWRAAADALVALGDRV